jgi:hypothetical protein
VIDRQRTFHELATIIPSENALASKIKMHSLKAFVVRSSGGSSALISSPSAQLCKLARCFLSFYVKVL